MKKKSDKVDELVSRLYHKHGAGVMVNILDLPKIARSGRVAYAVGGEAAADVAVAAAVAQYRVTL